MKGSQYYSTLRLFHIRFYIQLTIYFVICISSENIFDIMSSSE